ncbi:hypothetical protein [Polyangium jinanense]|nr:hypothetical protein [Polyangium jinanense]
MKTIHTILTAGLILVFGAGCPSGEKRKGRFDGFDGGIPPLREECNTPAESCYQSCEKRKASITCIGCCRDQRLLCDTLRPHFFDACEGAP